MQITPLHSSKGLLESVATLDGTRHIRFGSLPVSFQSIMRLPVVLVVLYIHFQTREEARLLVHVKHNPSSDPTIDHILKHLWQIRQSLQLEMNLDLAPRRDLERLNRILSISNGGTDDLVRVEHRLEDRHGQNRVGHSNNDQCSSRADVVKGQFVGGRAGSGDNGCVRTDAVSRFLDLLGYV